MTVTSFINFGMFKGRSIIDIWSGLYERETDSIIRDYLLERFAPNRINKTPCSDADLLNCTGELDFLNSHSVKFQIDVKKNYLIINSDTSKYNFVKIIKVIKSILYGSYADMTKTISYPSGSNVSELSFSENSSKFIALNGNPKYLKWCIENVNGFFIYPDDLEKLKITEIKVFKTFELIELEYDLIQYQPIFQNYHSPISLDTERINLQKYNAFKSMNSARNDNSYHSDSDSSTDWSHYNDDLDMDQQSPEFWNQF